ncbi:ester cyclase [Nocardia sp. CDC159]|uniref:Ester cyclase n=1 Tax=Nocardia pulmonis TaxID=2951408 RepID=A0A9X2E904_9NOCA|nr:MULTISPECIES: ester cyclase [Nocardia]MCM6776357.1 ester cyclase [Nocardia pulmonis]MCM6788781.1 ester cyclase [Nocardia sp. CDC159]
MTSEIDTLYRRWLFDLWSGDFDIATDICTPDFVGHWPSREVHGPHEAADQVRQSHALFSDIENILDVGPIVAGEFCAARWTFHGSYRGGIPGATAPVGTRVAFSGHDIFRVGQGRFVEYWVMSDGMGLMSQLGVG